MKKSLILFLLCYAGGAHAQTVEEWLRQKETARKYSLEQLAAWQAQLAVLKKGYSLVQSGWQSIALIKAGDLALHQAFISAAETVNPVIRRGPQTVTISASLHWAAQVISETRKWVAGADLLSPDEKRSAVHIIDQMNAESREQADQLLFILSAGGLRDDARLARLGRLLQEVQASQTRIQAFRWQVWGLSQLRNRAQAVVEHMRKIRGL